VVFLIVTRKGGQGDLPFDAGRYTKIYEKRLEKLDKKAGEMRADPAMAGDMAQFDSIFNLAKAAIPEIQGMSDIKAAKAKRAEMDDMWRAMKKLLKQEHEPDETEQ